MKKVAIIGAGAGGMMAAIIAARNKCNVTLFEKNDRVGKKILSTGNGKCNFTNKEMSFDKYYCEDTDMVQNALDRFGNNDLIAFFQNLGMLIKEKNGYYYPLSDQASTVLDILRNELDFLNINLVTSSKVVAITKDKDTFILKTEDNKSFSFDKVIMACGGKSGLGKNDTNNAYDILSSFGHNITPLIPALTQIKATAKNVSFPALKGVRGDCVLSAYCNDEFITKASGEVLFTEYGLSGIVSFQLSHLVGSNMYNKNRVSIEIDFMPGFSEYDLETFFVSKKLLGSNVDLQTFMIGILNKKLNIELIKYCNLSPSKMINTMTLEDYKSLINSIKHFKVECIGVNDFTSSQVTAGGVLLSELDNNFQSKLVKDLYIIGELTDVDGLCGGYNLQWAFTTGYIAGEAVCY